MKKSFLNVMKGVLATSMAVSFFAVGAGCSGCGEKLLKDAYKDYFKTGAMVAITPTADLALGYEDDVLKEFNSFTAENEMKWKFTEPNNGMFTFDLGDMLVKKAKDLGAKVRGHALVWHESVPDYLKNANKTVMQVAIQNHIRETVEHFGHETVYCWDVVNEAISDNQDPNIIYRSDSSDAKPSEFYKAYGSHEFIFDAFRAAREADSEIKLYYNDYNLNNPIKRAKAITMIKEMQAKGVPIDGVGEQAHYSIRNFDPVQFEQMIIDFTSLGLKMSITELDLTVYESDEEEEMSDLTPELLNLQAEVYSKIYEICRKYKDNIESVTTWGIGDDHSWLNNKGGKTRKDFPLLLDDFGDAKPAMQAIKDFNYTASISDEVKEDPSYNVYDGKGEEFHFGKWYGGNEEDGIYVSEDPVTVSGQAATEVYFYKSTEYAEARSNVAGHFSDFTYVNFKLAAKSGSSMLLMPQINYFVDGSKDDKCIGEESFDLTEEIKTVCIKLPSAKSMQMNLINEVWLFPEPGEKSGSGNTFKGTFYIFDSWFSKTVPDGVKEDDIIKPSGEGSAVSEKAYKRTGQDTWYNETSWSKINVKLSSEGLVDVKASGAATWSYVSVQLTNFDLNDDKLTVSFIDHMDTKNPSKPSVEYIRFRLRGSMRGMTNDGINTYMTYYDKDLIDWINGGYENDDYVQSSEGGPSEVKTETVAGGIKYTIVYDIGDEVKYLNDRGGIDLNGYGLRLVMLIESVGFSASDSKDYSVKYPKDYPEEDKRNTTVPVDKTFNITVTEVKTYSSTDAE